MLDAHKFARGVVTPERRPDATLREGDRLVACSSPATVAGARRALRARRLERRPEGAMRAADLMLERELTQNWFNLLLK